MDPRQENILRLARAILPRSNSHAGAPPQRWGDTFMTLLNVCLLMGALGSGYFLRECIRPLNYYEFITLHNMVESAAKREDVSIAKVMSRVEIRFGVTTLQELKAHQWKDVLEYLSVSGS
jgi:hypothetical protein